MAVYSLLALDINGKSTHPPGGKITSVLLRQKNSQSKIEIIQAYFPWLKIDRKLIYKIAPR